MNRKVTDAEAFAHPAWNGAVANAVRRAAEHKPIELESYTVYFDGGAMFVRHSKAAPPTNCKVICIAQRWDDQTVQLRYDGARSEWVAA